jgi:hypothetical protein
MIERSDSASTRINVLSWNMLLDTTRTNNQRIRAQRARLPGFIRALEEFDGQLDYVALQEVAIENGHNNGAALARALGFNTSFFFQHNIPQEHEPGIGRSNEYLGVFGSVVDNAEAFDIGHGRKAILSTMGNLAIINTHFRARSKYADVRVENAQKTVELAQSYRNTVITLDANERRTKPARQLLESAGFQSVFTLLGRAHPATFPVRSYRREMYGVPFGSALPGVAIDDILVRGEGIRVVNAGTIEAPHVPMEPVVGSDGKITKVPDGPSDHAGLWASIDAA